MLNGFGNLTDLNIRVAGDDGIGVESGFLGTKGRMYAPKDHGNASGPELSGELVRAGGGACDGGDSDKIGLKLRRNLFDTLIVQFQLDF